jgi:alkanesulfonate monooxygenase SsuD/methylene tetrahydromethanopterin reductase-like flavin-dependent oxidoreductase (luciferase family)
MDSGIGFFATHDAIGPAAVARLVEEHGHAALYFAEHSHIPASRDSPSPAAVSCRASTPTPTTSS